MAAIEDHGYMKVCAELASCLSISIAAARRKVERIASKNGDRGLVARIKIAETLLQDARSVPRTGAGSITAELDQLLEALDHEKNFMLED